MPSWAEKKTVQSHCSGDLSPFSYAYSREWTLLWVQIVSVDCILGRRQSSFLIPSLLSFVCSPFLSTIQLFLMKPSLLLASVTLYTPDVPLLFWPCLFTFLCEFLLLYLVFLRPQSSVLFVLILHVLPAAFYPLPWLWIPSIREQIPHLCFQPALLFGTSDLYKWQLLEISTCIFHM